MEVICENVLFKVNFCVNNCFVYRPRISSTLGLKCHGRWKSDRVFGHRSDTFGPIASSVNVATSTSVKSPFFCGNSALNNDIVMNFQKGY